MRRFLLPYLVVACFVLLILFLPSGNSVTYGDIGSYCINNSECPRNSYCYLEGGNNTCVCNHPYTPSPDLHICLARIGISCRDNDMCIENAFCNTEFDKYTCKCNEGFRENAAGDKCISMHCDKEHHCPDPAAVCRLVSGGFRCVCKDGYYFDEVEGACNFGSCGLDISTLRILLLLSMAVLTKSFSSF